jgi:hypothetical protein
MSSYKTFADYVESREMTSPSADPCRAMAESP